LEGRDTTAILRTRKFKCPRAIFKAFLDSFLNETPCIKKVEDGNIFGINTNYAMFNRDDSDVLMLDFRRERLIVLKGFQLVVRTRPGYLGLHQLESDTLLVHCSGRRVCMPYDHPTVTQMTGILETKPKYLENLARSLAEDVDDRLHIQHGMLHEQDRRAQIMDFSHFMKRPLYQSRARPKLVHPGRQTNHLSLRSDQVYK